MATSDEPVELVERVAALDLGKAALMACVRVPHEDRPGRRRQEIREYATLSRSLLELADWLRCEWVEPSAPGSRTRSPLSPTTCSVSMRSPGSAPPPPKN